jgi:hypothetical protein
VHGEPDARRIGARPLDPVPKPRGAQDVVARREPRTCGVGEADLRVTLEQHHPLVALALEPLPGRRRLARGHDPLDEHAVAYGERVEELVGRTRLVKLVEVQDGKAAATSCASESTDSGDPLARSTSRSHRSESPGAKSRSPSRRPASGFPTMPPASRRSAACSCSAAIEP